MTPKPEPIEVQAQNIPPELMRGRKWVCWKWEQRNGNWTKPLYSPRTGKHAKSDDASTWGTFAEAWRAYESGNYDGIGFVLCEADGYCGIDYDHVRDPVTGEIDTEALTRIKSINSYTEISPSQQGLKTIVKAKLRGRDRQSKHYSFYSDRRYFTITGHILGGVSPSIQNRQHEVTNLYRQVFRKKETPAAIAKCDDTPSAHSIEDDKIIKKALAAKYGGKFKALWEGDWSAYPSQSEGDQALCNKLVFWVGAEPARIDRLFRQSGLMRAKWDRDDYRERTIARAIEQTPETYKPRSKKGHAPALLGLEQLDELFADEIEWIWRWHYPKGMPLIIAGREGDGKTTTCVQSGKEILDENSEGIIIWVASEGFVTDTKDKMEKLGVDRKRFLLLRNANETFQFNFNLPSERKQLDDTLQACKENNLKVLAIFIDSIRGITPYDDNESKIKNVMLALNGIVCDKYGISLIYIDHHKKGAAPTLADKLSGSPAKAAAVRCVYAVISVGGYVKKIVCTKTNILNHRPPDLRTILTNRGLVIYDAEQSDHTLKDEAQLFLIDLFSKQTEYRSSEIYDLGEQQGFGVETLKKAKLDLGIDSKPEAVGKPWVWVCDRFVE